jgi:hypothetical protein
VSDHIDELDGGQPVLTPRQTVQALGYAGVKSIVRLSGCRAWEKAEKAMKKVDVDDIPFVAAVLAGRSDGK